MVFVPSRGSRLKKAHKAGTKAQQADAKQGPDAKKGPEGKKEEETKDDGLAKLRNELFMFREDSFSMSDNDDDDDGDGDSDDDNDQLRRCRPRFHGGK